MPLTWSPDDAEVLGFLSQGFLERGAPRRSDRVDAQIVEDEEHIERQKKHLVCVFCGNRITSDAQRIEKLGSHEHAFANPHGFVFHIGCFREAVGCFVDAAESVEFSWFSGYSWSLAHCSHCGYHLGWRFRGKFDMFFGLVTDRLVRSEDKEYRGA